ncbi:hypothetical protein M0R04_09900 [Candidatus Dojkabacteria bacterium]|nr:hypothetical protein [Candidatus Dojkabacteria bacterium]
MILITARSGWGKGLTVEGFIEEYHKAGYIVLVLADPKNEIELGYAQFLPKERYHLDALRREGKRPEQKKVKLYHPFTFRIPRAKIPDYEFFTFAIKDLTRKEWSMIAESAWDTDTIKLLLTATANIDTESGLYSFIHQIQEMVKGSREDRTMKPDPKNFYLSASAGTVKSIQDISNYLQPFKKDYFLAKDSNPLKLNWKKIFADQESYHVFVSNYLKDDKLKEFVILTLFNQIIEHKDLTKHPLLIVIPEVRFLVPFKPQGYKLFLAQGIKDNLSMMRSMGRGMTAILDTQVFSGVDEDVTNSATVTLFGELGGVRDIDKVAKSMNYKREIRAKLAKMEYPNSYLIVGNEDVDTIRTWFPSHMHCEPAYNFAEMFTKYYPERLKSYHELLSNMQKEFRTDEELIKDRIKKQEEREKKRREEARKAKEAASKANQEVKKKTAKAEEIVEKTQFELMRLIYLAKQADPKKSYRKLGEEFKLHHITIKRYLELYTEELAKQDSVDYETEALENLEGGKHEESNIDAHEGFSEGDEITV